MAVQTPRELIEALVAGDFDRLKGTPEDEWIDFKSQPYLIDSEKGKWEFAKDVAAMANAAGGLILLGIRTARNPNRIGDIAEEVRPIPKHLIKWDQHIDTLSTWVYPEIRGMRANWYPEDPSVEKGVLLIRVPAQDPSEQPFILRNMLVREEDDPIQAVGIPTRAGDRTTWMRAERVHHLLGAAKLRPWSAAAPSDHEQANRKRADERIESITREMQWGNVPTYFLQAQPPVGTNLTSELHGDGGIRNALARPESLRPMGFNLSQRGELETRDGGLVYVCDPRRVIWLERDGLFTVGAYGEDDFLGWANSRGPKGNTPLRINPLVLVEFTVEFFRLVYSVIAPRTRGEWSFRVVVQGWKSRSGGLQLMGIPASGDNLVEGFPGTGSAQKDAFVALTAVYALFGLSPQEIPYTKDGMVSEEEIKSR